MSQTLSVALNRRRLHDIEVDEPFTASEPFVVELDNHGEAMHVHLHLDDLLSSVASLEAGNHYVESGSTVEVGVDVAPVEQPMTGKLKIVTGYGAETAYADVTVEPPSSEKQPVEVDEDLARPQRSNPGGSEPLADSFGADDGTNVLAVAAFAAFAIVLAVIVGLLIDSALVLLGVGVLIGVVLVGAALAVR